MKDRLPLSVDVQMSVSCLCLALQQPAVWTDFASRTYLTHTCSIIQCIHLLIYAGMSIKRVVNFRGVPHWLYKMYETVMKTFVLCYVINAVTVGPGDQLVRPERKTHADREAEDDQVDSGKGSECYARTHTQMDAKTINIILRQIVYIVRICISDCEQKCCEIMAELVESLQSVLALGHHRNSNIPAFLTPTLRNVIISLARLPLVNSYTRIPPLVSEILMCSK